MQLYYHQTDGGAEYYSTAYITASDGSKEGTAPFIMRTDGNEIEIWANAIWKQGIKIKLEGKFRQTEDGYLEPI